MRTQRVLALALLCSVALAACVPTAPGANTAVPNQVEPGPAPESSPTPNKPAGQESQIAPEISDWLRRNAIPLTTAEPGGSLDDLMPLKSIIGDARIVALGEATHGTREFFQMKHRLLQFLVQELGFTVFALEANGPEADLLNEYVQTGKGDPAQLLAGLYYWTWDTQEVLDMIRWMRAYNESRDGAPALSFRGFDMQVPRMAVENVAKYVLKVDPAASEQVEALFSCFRPYQNGPQPYAEASQAVRTQCRQDLQGVVDLLLQRQTVYEGRSSPVEFAQALHSARMVQQAEVVFSVANGDHPARDRFMAENVSWLLDQAGPNAKMVLWAHDAHVGVDFSAGDSMGAWLRKQYGDAMVNFGLTFYRGSFNALALSPSGQFGDMAVHQAAPPPGNSYEYYLHSAGLARFALNLRGIRRGTPATDWLFGPHLLRYVGAGYTDANPEAFFRAVVLPEMFDVIVFFEDTSPSHLLGPQSGLSMPSPPTYPSQPGNLGFEDSTSSWALFSDRSQDYTMGTDGSILHGGAASGTIRSTTEQAAGFAALLQTCAADRYRGQRLRMSAFVKTVSVSKGAGVLLRVDSASNVLAIRNMQDRPIQGTTDWTRYDIVLDVPNDSSDIVFGAWIQETGQVWFDDFQLEAVGTDVPLTP